MSEDVYKAVFECVGLSERVVWYVSNRNEAHKQMMIHIKTLGGKKVQQKYLDHPYTLTVSKIFGETYEVFYNNVSGWSGT